MSQQEPEDQEQPGGCSAGACFAGPESPNAEKAAVRAPRDDAARWAGGAVIPSPALLLLLQTRKTLHHKGVWLLPQAPFLAAALRGASERARRLFLPLDLGAADWLRAGISGPRLPLHRQQLAASAVISCQPVMVADDGGVIWELSCETAPTKVFRLGEQSPSPGLRTRKRTNPRRSLSFQCEHVLVSRKVLQKEVCIKNTTIVLIQYSWRGKP